MVTEIQRIFTESPECISENHNVCDFGVSKHVDFSISLTQWVLRNGLPVQ